MLRIYLPTPHTLRRVSVAHTNCSLGCRRFMPQVISSAIGNVPPPNFVLEMFSEQGEKPVPVLKVRRAALCVVMQPRYPASAAWHACRPGRKHSSKASAAPRALPQNCVQRMVHLQRHLLKRSGDDAVLLGMRNWCLVTKDKSALTFQLRLETKLGAGTVHAVDISVPALAEAPKKAPKAPKKA